MSVKKKKKNLELEIISNDFFCAVLYEYMPEHK